MKLLVAALLVAVSALRHQRSYDDLRYSVVRVGAVTANFDWLRPFTPAVGVEYSGTGWVVQTEPYLLFVTNHHVVEDAGQVTLQLLAFGEREWPVKVVSVCPWFDLALLVLENPDEFAAAMTASGITVKALPLATKPVTMGDDVVSLGFPLGQMTPKIAKGSISGFETVEEIICIQSTAPISPGSSGGPLLSGDLSQVVGVNFAYAPDGENVNFVIPIWRVDQLVKKHLAEQPARPKLGWDRLVTKIPDVGMTTKEANDALYKLYQCQHGHHIAAVHQGSFLQKADPPVQAGCFITAVNGVRVDRSGMGVNPKFIGDAVYFDNLLWMGTDLSGTVDLETCCNGATIKHTVPLAWNDALSRGVASVPEPFVEGMPSKFEMVGDISVMQLTTQHIQALHEQLGDPSLVMYTLPDMKSEPQLIVNYVREGSYASQVLSPGTVIEKVNGRVTRTLDDFRKNFAPYANTDVWTLEAAHSGAVLAFKFPDSIQQFVQLANTTDYPLTPAVYAAAKDLGLIAAASAKGPAGSLQLSVPMEPFLPMAGQLYVSGRGRGLHAKAAGPVAVRQHSRGYSRARRSKLTE